MKRWIRLMAILCVLAFLGSCGVPGELSYSLEAAGEMFSPETWELEALSTPLYTDGAPAILWGREQLDEHTRNAYDRMSQAIAAYQEEPLQVAASAEEIKLILEAIRIDHPEYFWFDGKASFVTTSLAGMNLRTECTFTYNLDRTQVQLNHQAVRQYTAACLSAVEVSGAETDYDKILAVYRYLIEHTDYDLTDTDQSILGVMTRHSGTCAGYARAFQYLMSQLGIPCVLAMGEDADGAPHGWNMVQCEGEWYQMDVTWGDPLDENNAPGDGIQYTYCMITDEEMYRDHTLTGSLPMPECTGTRWHYFRREGLLFETWSAEAYQEAMASAAAQGTEWFSVRFTGEAAYQEACAALFEQEEIWDILRQSGAISPAEETVAYTRKDDQYEISVKLSPAEDTVSVVNEYTIEGSQPW